MLRRRAGDRRFRIRRRPGPDFIANEFDNCPFTYAPTSLASTFGIEVFPRQVYQFSQIPAEVVPNDVAIICIGAFIICSVAALTPPTSPRASIQ